VSSKVHKNDHRKTEPFNLRILAPRRAPCEGEGVQWQEDQGDAESYAPGTFHGAGKCVLSRGWEGSLGVGCYFLSQYRFHSPGSSPAIKTLIDAAPAESQKGPA